MSRVVRADWANETDWEGVRNKPATFGATDIGQLTGDGYANGQIPVYNASLGRFRPGSRSPAPAPVPPTPTPGLPTEISATLDFPLLHALQTAYEDVYFNGVFTSQPVIVGAPYGDEFVQISATVVDLNIVRVTVTNLGIADLDLGEGIYRLRIFNGT